MMSLILCIISSFFLDISGRARIFPGILNWLRISYTGTKSKLIQDVKGVCVEGTGAGVIPRVVGS